MVSIDQSLSTVQNNLRAGVFSAKDLVQAYLKNIENTASLNIYVEVFKEEALKAAATLDEKIKNEESLGRLFGAVISIKDVLCYKDHKVSAGSKMLNNFVAQYSATAIQRLIDEGAIIIGRTNCDEFAMGSTNEHSFHGPTKNGLEEDKVPGGSSGGAAVSVQMNTCLIGIGSDTGGSVRQPAAFCGVYGMKPTYGRISRYGLIAYGSSFDQIGIIAGHVDNLAAALEVMSGADPMDASCSQTPAPQLINARIDKKPYKIAYIEETINHDKLDPHIAQGIKEQLSHLEKEGHLVEAVSFDLLPYLVPAYYVLTTAEASSNLNRYDGVHYGHRTKDFKNLEELYEKSRTEGFGLEVKRRIMMGTFVLSVGYFDAYFTKAQQVRSLIKQKLDSIFKEYDFLITPTTTQTAWQMGSMTEDPVSMYLSDVYTVLANLGGIPAISIPLRSDQLSMPFGLQIMSNKYEEGHLLSFSKSF